MTPLNFKRKNSAIYDETLRVSFSQHFHLALRQVPIFLKIRDPFFLSKKSSESVRPINTPILPFANQIYLVC